MALNMLKPMPAPVAAPVAPPPTQPLVPAAAPQPGVAAPVVASIVPQQSVVAPPPGVVAAAPVVPFVQAQPVQTAAPVVQPAASGLIAAKVAAPAVVTGTGSAPSWMLKGTAQQTALQKSDAEYELNKALKDRLYRFWMPPNTERRLTFLDGQPTADGGILEAPCSWREHRVPFNGDFENFVCVASPDQPCPLCEAGSGAYLAFAFTVIDHTPYTYKKGQKAGQTVERTKRLYVAKPATFKQLQYMSQKNGGLAGLTIDVARMGDDKTPGVGNTFTVVQKNSLAELQGAYGEMAVPADYAKEIVYKSAEELLKLGLGKPMTGPGHEKGPTGAAIAAHL